MNLSARNILMGRVKQVAHGTVNTIELPGGTQIVSIITKSSAERLHVVDPRERNLCRDQGE
jgi:molybdopterin-binding protein